jgi:hypothetical protein
VFQTGIPRQFLPNGMGSARSLHIRITIRHSWGAAAVPSQNGPDFRPEILRDNVTRIFAGNGAPRFTDCIRPTN